MWPTRYTFYITTFQKILIRKRCYVLLAKVNLSWSLLKMAAKLKTVFEIPMLRVEFTQYMNFPYREMQWMPINTKAASNRWPNKLTFERILDRWSGGLLVCFSNLMFQTISIVKFYDVINYESINLQIIQVLKCDWNTKYDEKSDITDIMGHNTRQKFVT